MQENGYVHLSEAIGVQRNGQLILEGGALQTPTIVTTGGVLTGSGTLNATTIIGYGGVLRPRQIVMQPYSNEVLALNGEDIFHSEKFRIGKGRILSVSEGGSVAFDVSTETDESALVLEQARYFLFNRSFGDLTLVGNHNKAQLRINPLTTLTLNIERGFFARNQVTPLVEGRVDESTLNLPVEPCTRSDWRSRGYSGLDCSSVSREDLESEAPIIPFIEGNFTFAMRAGDSSYRIDLGEEGAVFRPRHNSLLSFTVLQTSDAIWLEAKPAFDDTAIFANAQSGDGLGVALRVASEKQDSPLQPVLGALQFADRDVAKAQSGALRGDGHASLRLSDFALLASFSGVVGQHLSSIRARGDGGSTSAVDLHSSGASMLDGSGDFQLGQLMMHINNPNVSGGEPRDGGVQFWARGFGQVGQLNEQGQVSRMSYNIGGVVLGMDKALADGKVIIGGNLGFGRMTASTRERQFRGEVDAIDIGAYVDADYGHGFVNLSARYTDLDHDTTRRIIGIEGLEGVHEADYGNSALSMRVEHGFNVRSAGGIEWQPLLPVIDYARLNDVNFIENGLAALVGSNVDVESFRVGAGLQVSRSFQTKRGEVVTPHARLLWQKELSDTQLRLSSAFFVEPDLRFGVTSQKIGDAALSWNLGVKSHATDRLAVLLDYVGQRTDGSARHGFMVGVGYRF